MVTQPAFDAFLLRSRHQALILGFAGTLTVLSHQVLVTVEDQNQPALFGASAMIIGVDGKRGGLHYTHHSTLGYVTDNLKQMTFSRIVSALCLTALILSAQAPPDPITLEQAIQEALANNANLLAERLNVPLAEARLVTARLRPNPVLSLAGDYLDILGTGFAPANGAGPAEGSARVDFVFEGPGKRAGRVAVAELSRSVAELNLQNAMRTLILDVQNAFVDVLLAKDTLALAEANQKTLESVVEANRQRAQAGEQPAAD